MNISSDYLFLFQMDFGQGTGEGNLVLNVSLILILFSQPYLCPYLQFNTKLGAVS